MTLAARIHRISHWCPTNGCSDDGHAEGIHEAMIVASEAKFRLAALQEALRAIVEDAFETDGADPGGGSQSLVATDLLERAQSLLAQADREKA